MSHDLPAPDDYVSGDYYELNVTVYDGDSDTREYKDLLDADVEYAILASFSDTVLVDDSDAGVSTRIANSDEGEIVVSVETGVTDELSGSYRHRLRVVDSEGRQNTYIGEFPINADD